MDPSVLDTLIDGSTFFRWREALWLPQWKIYCIPTPEQKQNIIKVARAMDAIRNRFGKPIQVTSWLRPTLYNQWKYPHGVGGAQNSAHCQGKAVDFKVVTIEPSEIQQALLPFLEHLGIRMERNTPTWTHIDIRDPGPEGTRTFYPPGSLG